MTEAFSPSDRAQRERIANSLDETLLVEAGAGTGKTSMLVARILNLVASGAATIETLVAITFTEAAAAELRERVRRELEARARASEAAERERAAQAVSRMDGASIQTLHSFAASILREMPLEAGLPPDFATVEEIEADLGFEQRWRAWLDEALDDPETSADIAGAVRLGLPLDGLRTVASHFHRSFDLLADPFTLPSAPRSDLPAARRIAEAAAEIRRLLPLARKGSEDPLYAHAERVATLGDHLSAVELDEDALALLARQTRLGTRGGRQGDWDADPTTGENGCTALKRLLSELEEARVAEVGAAKRAALVPLLQRLRGFALDYAGARRREGRAEFHDLLVWARDLLRDNVEAREHLQRRYTHILVDEYQDTDPIQAEIAFFLAGRPGDRASAWSDVKVSPGKLFLVGDPKQSIYRFRRADIASLHRVRGLLGKSAASLEQNFRSAPGIIHWVNAVFGQWMGGGAPDLQASYARLTPLPPPGGEAGPAAVRFLGGARDGLARQVREEEAGAIASLLLDVKASAWPVRAGDGPGLRPATFADVCILLPRRTDLGILERGLEAAGIPYRIESQSMVLNTQDVRELLDCLRAIDAPADEVALVAALRSSAFACSDVELLRLVEAGGRLSYIQPGDAGGPVGEALEALRAYHDARAWEPASLLVERFVRERRMVEACFASPRPRERWRRLRFVVERARAFAAIGGTSLRAFLDWMERMAQERARMVEVPVPESDEDAVRIMTVHAAKGLEFPIVVLARLDVERRPTPGPVIFDRSAGRPQVSLAGGHGGHFATDGYATAVEAERAADGAEGVRLMYVAATRARDHLVVSMYRPSSSKVSAAAALARIAGERRDLWQEVSPAPSPAPAAAAETPADGGPADTADQREAWMRRRRQVVHAASAPASVSATALAHVAKDEAGEEPYQRGRGGTSLGRAVHSVLQSVDLETGEGIEEVSRAQADAEGVPQRWRDVARLARVALASAAVRRAVAGGKYYREVFVAAPTGGTGARPCAPTAPPFVAAPTGTTLLEGFVDLLFQAEDGLVIVDYKTDALQDRADAARAAERYALQVGAYALAVEQATGMSVAEVVLLFLHPGLEVPFTDLGPLKVAASAAAREAAAR